ncbi:MAG TPA: DGQHR domain-containing protein [Flavobacteriales bacterium]|jgi:DGQHR domain-containing protein|nr:DGQHR domain-containing protein [Flavobacteriales bacterium]
MGKVRIAATVLRQKDKELYLFKINSALLSRISFVTPRTEENPDELQRVVNIARAKEIGNWLKDENSLLPNAIVVDLKENVEIEETGVEGQVTISFPNPEETEDHKVAYVLDGQHRLKGFDHADGLEFDLAVVAVHNVSESVRAKLFIDINSKQVKVDERLLLDLMADTRILANDDERVYEVIKGLNDEPGSPLHQKVQFLPEQKHRWMKNTTMLALLKPHIGNGGILYGKTTAQLIEIFTAYFKAYVMVFPEAWTDQKKYILTKNMGFEIMCGIFREIKYRCDLYEGKQLNRDSFMKQISLLEGREVTLKLKDKSTINIPLNWSSNSMGQFSSKQWIREIVKEIINMLNAEA